MDFLFNSWYGILMIVLLATTVIFVLSVIFYKQIFKRVYDFLLSLIAIIILSPLFIILTPLVAVMVKGNPFFVQMRPGKKCKIFKLIKYRTMTNEKDEFGNLLPDEQRLTKFGKLMRKTSLDELPELFNILKGDMSIVGPRPLLVKYLSLYNEEQIKRQNVRPGLTGLAQVNGRNAISWEQKFEYDLEYIQNITLFKDIKIIIKTALKVLKCSDISSEGQATMEEFTGTKEYEENININQ